MDRVIEFATAHYILVGSFLGLLIAFLFLESRRGGKTVSCQELSRLVNSAGALVLDVRESKEFREGHITGAKNIAFASLAANLKEIESYKDKPVILVCKMGQHSGAAGKVLSSNGFTDVRRLSGGISGWQADGLPLIKKSK